MPNLSLKLHAYIPKAPAALCCPKLACAAWSSESGSAVQSHTLVIMRSLWTAKSPNGAAMLGHFDPSEGTLFIYD